MDIDAPLHIAWDGVPYSLSECQLACALTLYIRFEDGTQLDDQTIDMVIEALSGLQNVSTAGLVNHLILTSDVYPEVLNDCETWALLARHAWNMWLDPEASPVGCWP